MKILLTIHHNLDPNAGAPGVTWQLGQEYQKLGHEVRFYTFDNLPNKFPGLIKSIVFPEFVASHVSALSKQEAVDVVDASTGDAWVWAKIRPSRDICPLLVTRSHGLEHINHLEYLEEAKQGKLRLSWKYPLYQGGFRLWEVAVSLRCADLALLLNRRDAKYAIENLGVAPNRTRIVANGMPQAFLNLGFEPISEAKDAVIRLAIIGSYIPRKGIHYAAPALNSLLGRYSWVEVSFIGTISTAAEVLVNFDPAIRERLRVVPRYSHDTLPALLRGHHIKLFPTLSEGFGLALIEAMACGLAPVTTTTPGPMEIVQDGHNGILVPPRDSQALEKALELLITDRPYLNELRRNAYSTAQNYSWARIARDNLDFYEQALCRRRGS